LLLNVFNETLLIKMQVMGNDVFDCRVRLLMHQTAGYTGPGRDTVVHVTIFTILYAVEQNIWT
jgi:hypothetical protein